MALSVWAGPADGALLPKRSLEAAKPHRPRIHREQAAGERLSLRRSRVLRRSGLGRTCGACGQRLSGFSASAEQRLRSVRSEISANVQHGRRLDRVCLPPRPRPSAWAAADDLMRFISGTTTLLHISSRQIPTGRNTSPRSFSPPLPLMITKEVLLHSHDTRPRG